MCKVINFHDVHDGEWFGGVIEILKKKYNLISLSEFYDLFSDGKKLKNSCLITVDDGDRSFYDTIYPVLKKYQVPAALFVSPQICLNGTNFWFQEVVRFNKAELKKTIAKSLNVEIEEIASYNVETILKNCSVDVINAIISEFKKEHKISANLSYNISIQELKEIDRDDLVTIGAHTQNHPVLANEVDNKSREEIMSSIDGLEEILGHKIGYFAYPNGVEGLDFGSREIAYLMQANCKLAFSTEPRNVSIKDNPLAIPRFGITHGNMNFIKAKLLLGKYWEIVRGFKQKPDKQLRIELKKKYDFVTLNQ